MIFAADSTSVMAQSSGCVPGAVTADADEGLVRDCEALLDAKDTLKGTADLNWSPTLSINTWTGISLGGTPRRVTKVKLQKKDLTGEIPAVLGRLDMLEELWLYVNELSGTVPPEIGDLSNLRWLFVSNNSLEGQIPDNLNSLSLDRLWLNNNNFTGCVPYNLTLTREYKVDRGLPACAPPGGETPPTATPQPGATPTPVPTATPTPQPAMSLSDMVKRVRPAVVKITSPYSIFARGTGFIFRTDTADRSAHILTNYHVVGEDYDLRVQVRDSDWYIPQIVHLDPRRDIAVLRICCADFVSVDFTDSDTLFAGDEVIAVGYPLDCFMPRRVIVPGETSVTRGIISAFRYDSLMDAQLVQTDTTINGGTSGGPLFAPNGQVVAMNTWGLTGREINFSVLETTIQDKLSIWEEGPSNKFGPIDGELAHNSDGFYEEYSPVFEATEDEFAISATFVNPYDADDHKWNYGFRFGKTGDPNDQYLYFVVDSTGYWSVIARKADGSTETLHSGTTPQLGTLSLLKTGAGQRNELTLRVDGRYGWLYVNDWPVRELEGHFRGIDVGKEFVHSHEGRVAIITGLLTGSERPGSRTRYEDFSGITYDRKD